MEIPKVDNFFSRRVTESQDDEKEIFWLYDRDVAFEVFK